VLTALFVIGLIGLAYWRLVVGYRPAPPGLAVLIRSEVAFIEAAAEVLFPAGIGPPVAGIDARLPHYIDRHLAALPMDKRWQIRALFLLLEHLTLVIPGNEPAGRSRFSSLNAASRVAFLENIERHRWMLIRLLFIAMRGVLVLGYLGHPINLRELDVAPYEIDRAVSDAELLFPRIGGLVSSIEWGIADRTTDQPRPPLDPDGPRHRAYARSSRDAR